jgi:hypothetical protein
MVGSGEVEEGPLRFVVGRYLELAAALGLAPAGGAVTAGRVGASWLGRSGRLNRRRATLY